MFRPGSVRSLSLTNFQVFAEQTFSFGPALNLVAAPNGSGKSTISHAFALLFGSHHLVGSSRRVEDFVRFGETEASIRAVVFVSDTQNIVCERRIVLKSNGHSSASSIRKPRSSSYFYIDSNPVASEDFSRLVSSLGINLCSLCTFLPQERVAEFCRLEAPALLRGLFESAAMLKSANRANDSNGSLSSSIDVARESTLPDLEFLSGCRSSLLVVREQLKEAEESRERIATAVSHLAADAAAERERRSLKERLVVLRYKREYMLYSAAVAAYEKARERAVELSRRVSECEAMAEDKRSELGQLRASPVFEKYNESVGKLKEQNRVLQNLRNDLRKKISDVNVALSALRTLEERCESLRISASETAAAGDDAPVLHSALLRRLQEILRYEVFAPLSDFVSKNSLKNRGVSLEELRSAITRLGATRASVSSGQDEMDASVKHHSANNESVDDDDNRIHFVAEFEAAIRAAERAIEATVASYNDNGPLRSVQYAAQILEQRIAALETRLAAADQRDEQRLALLAKYHPDTHRAVLFLRSEEAKSIRWRGVVAEPAFLHIEVHDNYQDEIEALLGFQALSSFIVTDQKDFVVLARILKDEKRLAVNIAEVSNYYESDYDADSKLKAEHFPCSRMASPRSIDRDMLTQYGFDGVASDFVVCQPLYAQFLDTYGHFSQIPIAKREVAEAAFFARVPGCRRMIVAGRYVEIKRSRYDSTDFLIVSSRIGSKKLLCSQNSAESLKATKSALEAELDTAKTEREQKRAQMKELYVEITSRAAAAKEWREEQLDGKLSDAKEILQRIIEESGKRQRAIDALAEYSRVKRRTEETAGALDRARQDVTSIFCAMKDILGQENVLQIDTESLRTAELDVANVARELVLLEHRLAAVAATAEESRVAHARTKREVNARKTELRAMFAANSEVLSASLEELRSRRNDDGGDKEKYETVRAGNSEMSVRLAAASNGMTGGNSDFGCDTAAIVEAAAIDNTEKKTGDVSTGCGGVYRAAINSASNQTGGKHTSAGSGDVENTEEPGEDPVSQIDAEIRFVKKKLAALPDGQNVLQEYADREKHLVRLEQGVAELKRAEEAAANEYAKAREEAMRCVQRLVVPVSECFSRFLGRCGASGRIEPIISGDNHENWGLSIHVSFRAGTPEERLSAYRQSGGEKSLATALFLLALQHCVSVPFRLLDEINQGMDASNERRLFTIIREMSVDSQLFIITPKLVSGVEYELTNSDRDNETRVAVIYSGAGVDEGPRGTGMVRPV